jgi:hypothetical protein
MLQIKASAYVSQFLAGLIAMLLSAASVSAAQIIQVGPLRAVKSIADAAKRAVDGDLVEVDAGDYLGDVAVWSQKNLKLRAVAGRVRLLANGLSAEGKAIWIIRDGQITVEGFDFLNARVPDRNGAGIRFESGRLTVRNCSFQNNEMGLLTSNNPSAELVVENSEFAHNGRPDGHNHNLYVGRIARLTVTGSYFHHGATGHLLKSRAAQNHVMYNRLTDELGGHSSYELEFPDGGVAYVIGNIIGQSAQTENSTLISFGAEGYKWPTNEIYLINNTLIDETRFGGTFLRVKAGAGVVKGINNLLVGSASLESASPGEFRNNVNVDSNQFERGLLGDFRLKSDFRWATRAIDPGRANDRALRPHSEYVHPRGVRALDAPADNLGAMQRIGRHSP